MKKILTPITGLLFAALSAFSQSQTIDNFESGNLGQWTLVSGAAGANSAEVFSGNFALEMSESSTFLLHNTFNGGPGRYRVNFLCEGAGAAFQFYFQYQDAGNYYGVMCSPETSQLNLVKVVSGVEETLSSAPAALFTGQWHELVVERGCDDQLVVLLDGAEEIAVSDAAVQAAGAVALGAVEEMVYADELRFDAFQPEVQIVGETAFCIDPAVLEASGAFAQYEWSTGSKSNRVEIPEPGIVWLEVTDQNGCTARDTVEVLSLCPTQFYAPNIFSPNYDGVNDEFRIYPRSQPLRFELSVFNRWGELVFRTEQADEGWDGVYKGAPAPADIYIWLADMDGFTLTGTLNLLR